MCMFVRQTNYTVSVVAQLLCDVLSESDVPNLSGSSVTHECRMSVEGAPHCCKHIFDLCFQAVLQYVGGGSVQEVEISAIIGAIGR